MRTPRFGRPDLAVVPRADGVGRNLFLTLGFIGAQGLVRLLAVVVAARALGAERYGQVGTVLAVSTFVCIGWPASVGPGLTKFVGRAHGEGDSERASGVGQFLLRRAAVATLAGALVAVAICLALGERGGIAVAAVPMTIGLALQYIGRGVHLAAGMYVREGVLQTSATVVSLIAVYAGCAVSSSGVLVLLALSVPLICYGACVVQIRSGRLAVPISLRRESTRFVSISAVGSLASAGFMQLSVVAARATLGSSAAGLYSAAVALATPISIAAAAATMASFPAFARAHGRRDRLGVGMILRRSTRLVAVLVVPGSIVAMSISNPLVSLVYGDAFRGSAAALRVLVAAVCVTALAVPSVGSLTSGAQRDVKFMTMASLVGLSTGVLCWSLGLNDSGAEIGLGFLIGVSVTGVWAVWLARKRFGVSGAEFLLGVGLVVAWLLVFR